MSSSPNSPRPHSSQGPFFESEAMTSRASIASHIHSRSWRTVEDGGEEASQIDLSIDSSSEVGLEFGDDGSVRLVLLSSGEGQDRRSRLLPHVSEKRRPIPIIDTWVGSSLSGSDVLPAPETDSMYTERISSMPEQETTGVPKFGEWDEIHFSDSFCEIFSKVREEKQTGVALVSRPPKPSPKRSQITKLLAKILLIVSIFKKKKKRHTDTLCSSVEKAAASSLLSGQTKPPIKIVPRATNIGLAHIFSYEELNQATKSFKHELADGGFSRVYFGKLQDGRKVAVKVLYEGVPKRMEQFLNEVTVLSRLRHKNLVALYGCTDPETQKLLLVYEFVPNGTIADHLHGQLPSLTWDIRMQIAIETAEALSYLHSCEPPIIHRDVKTSNILLDDDYHAKVADLGMCRLVPWDTTSVSTLPQGTVGYRDPEYDELCKLTLKSDVYSFGVVLLELISGKPAVDVYREETEIYLFKMAVKKILNKELDQLVDLRLGYGSNSEISRMVSSVAALSCVCLQPKADPRPPMVEVYQILKGIRDGMHYA